MPTTPSVSRRPARVWVAFLTVSVAVALLSACGPGRGVATTPNPAPVATVAAGPPGAAVYQRSCARCHGADRAGKEGNPAVTQARLAAVGDQQLRMNIAYGKGKMPAFGGLTEAQVNDLVTYLRGA